MTGCKINLTPAFLSELLRFPSQCIGRKVKTLPIPVLQLFQIDTKLYIFPDICTYKHHIFLTAFKLTYIFLYEVRCSILNLSWPNSGVLLPQSLSCLKMGANSSAIAVSSYSTRGGTSAALLNGYASVQFTPKRRL